MTLDGVMQAPGGPEEDTSGGFRYGGWSFPLFDDFMGKVMMTQMGHDYDLLLGRKTYEIFAAYWPTADTEKDPGAVTRTLKKADWNNSIIINDNVVEEIRKLKESEGPEIQVHGSTNLIQTLWKADLVDELWLKIFPVTVGQGKRLFENETFASGFELISSKTSPKGVIVANYKRSGEVKTGSF